MHQQECFKTPYFKKMPNMFVAKRSDYSIQAESSPLPGAFGDFADEDMWMKMNKGFKTDLDLLHMTTARKFQSFPISEDCSTVDCNQEIQNLHEQLKIVTDERDELKCILGGQISRWKQAKENELNITKQRCEAFKKVTEVNNQLLKVSEGKFRSLEREFQLLKEDKEAALHRISSSSKVLAETIDQWDKALKS